MRSALDQLLQVLHTEPDAPILAFAAVTYAVLWPVLSLTDQIQGRSQNAALGVALAATLGLLAWCVVSAQAARQGRKNWYHALRTWSLASYQLGSPIAMLSSGIQLQMQLPPRPSPLGALIDLLRILPGSRCHMPLFLGAGLPLQLMPQMAVQTAAIASIMLLRNDCSTPLLASPLTADRISSFHSLMSLATLALWPGGFGGPHQQCAAALDFLLILVGWLLPVYLVARRSWQEARAAERQNRPLTANQRLATRLLKCLFLDRDLPEHRAQAWYCLVVLCWVLALGTAALGLQVPRLVGGGTEAAI